MSSSRRRPDRAVLQYWPGKSYARLADIPSPVSAAKDVRKARHNFEQAVVKLAPQKDEYLLELSDFYVDSPEWFGLGLERDAALLERVGPGESGVEERLRQLADLWKRA